MSNLNFVGKLAWVLVIVGALNWGLVAINADWNLVTKLLGTWPVVVQVVYALVGISALVSIFGLRKKGSSTTSAM